ncbi:MAG: exodeoxyribonuclease VII small subunit [Bacteroidales bacterium]|jgi:exodeoxyribonuclease VII small subunit|nr:exodeoxyribonuclease VII small subunit [Bacteroidales bacterium]
MEQEKIPSYTEAYTEIQDIVKRMENDDISVDELAEQMKRASFLIKICKDKLLQTEKEVDNIMGEA